MTLFFVFILGIFVGSFLNVLVDRLPLGESVIKGRSHCEKCKKELAWFDLIPLFSFLLLRGKCRYCRSPLSFYHPIVELTTGAVFVITFLFIVNNFQFSIYNFQSILNLQFSIYLIYHLFIVSSLIVIFFADLKYGIIPDKIIFPAILVSFLFLLFTSKESWFLLRQTQDQSAAFEAGLVNHLLSAVGACLFFLLLFLITKGKGMGFGDVKLAFLMGLILGFPKIVVSLYIAFLTGAIVGIILIIWRKKRIFGTAIPFGPFLVMGTLAAIFFGEILSQSFLRLALSSTTF